MARGITTELKRGSSTYKVHPKDLVIVGIDTDHKEGEHQLWRKVEKPKADLIASVKEVGVQKDVWGSVEKIDGKDRIVVVDGRTRTLAAREAGLSEVSVTIKKGNLFGLSFLANLGAHGETPLAIAKAAAKMVEAGDSLETIATFLQVGIPMVRIYLSLNELEPSVRGLVEKGEMSMTAASKLKGLSPEEQKKAVEEMRARGELSVAAASQVRASKQRKNGRRKTDVAASVPKKRVLRRLVEAFDEKELEAKVDVKSDFWLGVKFSQGLINPRSIKGLSDAIREVSPKKRATA